MTIGFIGLGRIGRPMALHLCRKGFRLIVHDINPAPVRDLAELRAQVATGAPEIAAASDVVLTMLPNSAIVEQTIAGADGVLAHAKPGTLIVDMSTIDPLVTDRLARAAAGYGVAFAAAPVWRLASHADRAECLFIVVASDAQFARVTP